MTYNPAEIEPKWQKVWEEKPPYKAKDFASGGKYYALVEFPYPSGEGLHVGHAFTYVALDVLARKKRMEGNVLYPMGWDAFGLPTENYAVRTGIHPAVVTRDNTDRFRQQMKRLALAYDWEREINTTDPQYYRWTQWIFLKFFEKGLAYKAKVPVGWCPSCKIILANEEIVAGKCERCGAIAERRQQKQWLLKITAYADRLADELDLVDYPESAKAAQRNWIGRKEGARIKFKVKSQKLKVREIEVFTTRPDTIFGATFLVVAPEHELVSEVIDRSGVREYIKQASRKSELERTELAKEKTGVDTGLLAVSPLSGTEIPVWIADFVLPSVGTGAIMGVPAHDQRDYEFARKFGLEIIPVVDGGKIEDRAHEGPGRLINSGRYSGLDYLEGQKAIIADLESMGAGGRAVNYHLRDWVFSRQHYWGEPIPIINCQKCGLVPVPEKDLPVELPDIEKFQPTTTGESPLANISKWVNVFCPQCHGEAKRETDTMPNWAGSSWYYLRFIDPHNDKALADGKKLDYWMPVDLYLGGAEHTTLHLLYSRFWHKFLNGLGLVPGKEPYLKRRQHGIILAENGEKMSKSRGNVINPDKIVARLGLDAMRLYLAFMGPYDQTMPWNTKGVEGSRRFLNRIWQLYHSKGKIAKESTPALANFLNRTIKKTGNDIDNLKNNTAVAAMMEFLNAWERHGQLSKVDAEKYLKLLSIFAPHIAEEIWVKIFRNDYSITQQSWPKVEKSALPESAAVVVTINSKPRGVLEISKEEEQALGEKGIIAKAKSNASVAKFLIGKTTKRIVYVPGKIINFVNG